MLACTLQVMCQRWAVSLHAVVDWSANRGTKAIGRQNPVGEFTAMAPKALNTVVRTLDRLMSGAKSTTQDGNIDAAQRTTRAVVPALSVIVPLYNEEESVGPLYEAIVQALASAGPSPSRWCSSTTAAAMARSRSPYELARTDPRVRVVKFRRNYGQTAAMAAGIEHARGDVIVTMDGDLQNDPRRHRRCSCEQIDAGLRHRGRLAPRPAGQAGLAQDPLAHRQPADRARSPACRSATTAARSRPTAPRSSSSIPLYSEMHRFIPAMASIAGPRIAEIKVRHHARQFGKSKYGLSRIYKVLLDLHGDQDRRLVHVAAAALVRDAVAAAAGARRGSLRLHRCSRAARDRAPFRCRSPAPASSSCRRRSSYLRSGALGELDLQAGRPARARILAAHPATSACAATRAIEPMTTEDADDDRHRLRSPPSCRSAAAHARHRARSTANTAAGLAGLGRTYEFIFVLDGPRPEARGAARATAARGREAHGHRR